MKNLSPVYKNQNACGHMYFQKTWEKVSNCKTLIAVQLASLQMKGLVH